jgi:dihydropyrimidinase
MTILIKNGRIVTAADDYVADILIRNGSIHTIGKDIQVSDDIPVHDATGLLVLPGGVDVHTHLEFNFGDFETVDDFETGTRSAAFGGTTTLVDFCNQGDKTPLAALENWHQRAEKACIDVSAHVILNKVDKEALAQMPSLIHDEGITSFKLFTAYPGIFMIDDAGLFKALRQARDNNAMICVHAENGGVIEVLIEEALAAGYTGPKYHEMTRPSIMEGEATQRVITLAEMAEASVYIVHLSATEALNAVTAARDRGISVYAETCPHYLFLDKAEYERTGFEPAKYVMTPPLRDCSHQRDLWRGLKTDDLQVVSTDHCPFCFHEQPHGMLYSKQQGVGNFQKIPNGAPGVETRLPLVFDGGVHKHQMSINRFVQLTSTAPAKLFGLFPRKGTIAVGSDADIVIFDPEHRWTIRAEQQHSRVDYSLYEGKEITGKVKKVFLGGRLIVEDDVWHGKRGMGQFIKRGESGRV